MVELKVADFLTPDILYKTTHRCSITLATFIRIRVTTKLLYRPYGPQRYVGKIDLTYCRILLTLVYEPEQCAEECVKYLEIIFFMVYGESAAGKRDQLITGTDIIPGIACHDICAAVFFEIKLFG